MDAWHRTDPQGPASVTDEPAPPPPAATAAVHGTRRTHGGPDTPDTTGTTDTQDAWDTLNALNAADVFPEPRRRAHCAHATPEGAAWLASAGTSPHAVAALWTARPAAPGVLLCGTVFDVVDLPALYGRRVLGQLWAAGRGCGPVAVHHGRVMVFAAPGTAQRLPSLLDWEEWARAVPPLLFHGTGDAVTVPSPYGCAPDAEDRWVVAPWGLLPSGTQEDRGPWLPDAAVLLWACVRAARPTPRRNRSAPGQRPRPGLNRTDFPSSRT